jgi:micrococcal nuclease
MPRREDFGRILPTHRWQGEPRWRGWWRAWRWWLFAAVLLAAMWLINQAWPSAPPLPAGTPQRIAAPFHRCGSGRGPNCVVDGDTFIMAARHFRITGIDAPEIGSKARCPAEAALAEAAAAELLALLNQGPFIVRPPSDGLRDGYGRELVAVTRQRSDGSVQDLAADLVAGGKVRRYDYGAREPWC